MKNFLVVQKIENVLSLDVTEIANELKLSAGDCLSVYRTERGFELVPSSKTAANLASDFLDKYPSAMKQLAK